MQILESNWDEFNSYPSVNFYEKYFDNPHVVIFEGYECLYPMIKNKIIIERPINISQLNCQQRDDIIRNKILQLVTEQNIITNKHCLDKIHPNTHLYKFLFSCYTKNIIESKIPLFVPPEYEIIKVNNLLKNIKNKIVCINGRNLNRNTAHNTSFYNLIKFLIDNDVYVINCTFNQPNFNFCTKLYWEPKEQLLNSYNFNCALFNRADYVISIGSAASITTHLMTPSNIIILGECGWIDNPNFGYLGETMLSARSKYYKYKTIYEYYNGRSNHIDIFTFNKILSIINS